MPAAGQQHKKAGARSKNSTTGSSNKRHKTVHENHPTISNMGLPSNSEDLLKPYFAHIDNPRADEDCAICCERLCDPSGYESSSTVSDAVKLVNCKHEFHKSCLLAMYRSGTKDGSLQCPSCKAIYGTKFGNCPKGTMEWAVTSRSLPGFADCGSIRIVYHIHPGIQGPEHPNPGQKYNARGFPRFGFLPDNDQGRKVLQLLIKAWERRLTFTIGTSVTTGETDTVVWNEIHHKTEMTNHSEHGYPDPNYLDNVTAELAIHGITSE